MNNDKLFYCYSINLLRYLKNNGLRYLCKGINEKTNKNYWIFEKTDRFRELQTEFTKLKNNALKDKLSK